ncbi:alpha/beta hydrolase [Caldimonas brevitalea]|uniref:Phospholipase/carboxylesterase n=1 Tax=Caldimonas brevitalea TaxID=413882 RepID=A0A0G3BFQ8_9BURK|nr:PHB depolymerase family esterase [Caldimonas brevitalea]AKJ28172.1 phospholipase/carboxylesterase [Caldimonas brevitalea]
MHSFDPGRPGISGPLHADYMPLVYRWRAAHASATRRPLLVLLHGVGGDEMSLAPLIASLPTDLHVALVRGPIAQPEGGYAWYTMQQTGLGLRANADQAEAAREQLLQLLTHLRLAHPFDPRQVYVAGFSQGGVMSASVGLTRPDKVAAIGVLCGRILPQVKWQLAPGGQLSRLQAFVAHGGADDVIPSEHAVDTVHTLAEHRVQLLYRDYPGGHEISAEMAADFVQWVAQRCKLAYRGGAPT